MFVGAFVPNWLLCRVEVGQGAKLCYARLAQYAGQDGHCFPKQDTLAAELGISERTAREYLRELEEFVLIEAEQHGLGISNSYHFLDHSWIQEGHLRTDAASAPERQSPSGPDRQKTAAPERRTSSGPSREENQKEENQELLTQRVKGLPCNESEAVEAARLACIPDDFARTEYNRMAGVGWLDGCQRPVRSWPHYLKQRWSHEQGSRVARVSRTEKSAASTPGPKPKGGMSVPQELYLVSEELAEIEADMESAHRLDQPPNEAWRNRARHLRQRLTELRAAAQPSEP